MRIFGILALIFLLICFMGFVSATALTIKGKAVDQLTGMPINGAKLMSAYEFSPAEVVTGNNGKFEFTITDDFKLKEGAEAVQSQDYAGYAFYDTFTNCYDYGYVDFQKNRNNFNLALIKRTFDSQEEVTNVSGKSIIDVGDVKMYPSAEIKTNSDIESSMEIQYKYKNLQGYNGGGSGGYTLEHSSIPGVPIDYDVFIRFTEENGKKHDSSPYHVPLDAMCKTVYLNYENKNSEWSVVERGQDTNLIELNLKKGWNLIPVKRIEGILPDSELKKEDIVVAYIYFAPVNKYIQLYPEKANLQQELASLNIDSQWMQNNQKFLINSGEWVYSLRAGKIKISSSGDLETIQHHKNAGLKQGWNFKTISPSMKNKKFSEIKGNCNILKVAEWNADSQKWNVKNFADLSSVSLLNGDINKVGAFKVASDCQFGSSGSAINPPSLPDTNTNLPSNDNPVDFPQTIGSYTLKSNRLDDEDCGNVSGQEICVSSYRLEYIYGDSAIHILPAKISSGKQAYIDYLKTLVAESNYEGKIGVMHGKERWEIYWFTEGDFDAFGTQTYQYIYQSDGSINSKSLNATTNNPVIQYFLNKYAPIII